jgi:hypothetical protein
VWSAVGVCFCGCVSVLDPEDRLKGAIQATFCVYIAVVIIMVCVIFAPEGSEGNECKAAAGTYCPPGYGSVLPCPMGYICAGSRFIESLTPNSNSPSQSSARADCACNADYSGDAGTGTCTACAAGKYKSAAEGTSTCIVCPAGKYSKALWDICTICFVGKCAAENESAKALSYADVC